MKFVSVVFILIASLVAVQAIRYEISLDTFGLPKYPVVKGKIWTRVYGKDFVNRINFTFDEDTFGTKMTLKHGFEFDEEIEKVVLRFAPYGKKRNSFSSDQGTFGLGAMTVTNMDISESVVYDQTYDYLNEFKMAYFDKPGNTID